MSLYGNEYRGTSLYQGHSSFLADLTAALGAMTGNERMRWVSPLPGDEDADGSVGRPFNPVSAAAARSAGLIASDEAQIQEALNDIGPPADTAEAGVPMRVLCAGGEYDAQKVRPVGHGITSLVTLGQVRMGNVPAFDAGIEWTLDGTTFPGLSFIPTLHVYGVASQPNTGWLVFGDILIEDGGLNVDHGLHLGDVGMRNLAVKGGGSLAGRTRLHLIRCSTLGGAVNLPDADCYTFRDCQFGATTLDSVEAAARYNDLASVTLSSAPIGGDPSGFYACAIAGTFTGPAGTARFDKVTQDMHGAGFAGGAGAGDYLE